MSTFTVLHEDKITAFEADYMVLDGGSINLYDKPKSEEASDGDVMIASIPISFIVFKGEYEEGNDVKPITQPI